MKIAINACYGGFNLSNKAFVEWARLKDYGIVISKGYGNLWAIKGLPFSEDFLDYEDGKYDNVLISVRDIPRDDSTLINLIETLGSKECSGRCASLKIVEIPDDVKWEIQEYDGFEHIAEVHRTWS